jgi:hypothetical protein
MVEVVRRLFNLPSDKPAAGAAVDDDKEPLP